MTVGEQIAHPEGYPDDFQADLEREEKAKFSFDRPGHAVFAWRADGRYLQVKPLSTIYKRESAAQKACDRLNATWVASAAVPRGYVVRETW